MDIRVYCESVRELDIMAVSQFIAACNVDSQGTEWYISQNDGRLSECGNSIRSDVNTECCTNRWLYIHTTWPLRIRIYSIAEEDEEGPGGITGCGIIDWHQHYRAHAFQNSRLPLWRHMSFMSIKIGGWVVHSVALIWALHIKWPTLHVLYTSS
jgi:hypothetical protein